VKRWGGTREAVWRRLAAILTAAATSVAVLAGPTSAAADPWAATFVGQSDFLTLESGETGTSWFDARNDGTYAWAKSYVRLGTQAPQDRSSAFCITGTWISCNRPTSLDQDFVQPGQVGRFTFLMKAPPVSQTTTFDEHFEPVAEPPNCNPACGAWMNWGNVFLRYVVIPGEPPSVHFSSAPSSVKAGDPLRVTATATDNRAVDHVLFSLESQQVNDTTADSGPNTYGATLDTSSLSPGFYTVYAKAFDRAGYSSTTSASFSVSATVGSMPSQPGSGQSSSGSKAAPLLNLLLDVVPGSPRGGGVPLSTLRLHRAKRGRRLLGPDPRGATVTVTCRRGCRSRTLRMRRDVLDLRFLTRHAFPPGTRFSIRAVRKVPRARGKQWVVEVTRALHFVVPEPKIVDP
jgi:hypothetical protein